MKIELVKGVGGVSLYIDDMRVKGPKPWGGGTVIHSFDGVECPSCTRIADTEGLAKAILAAADSFDMGQEPLNQDTWPNHIAAAVQRFLREEK